MCTKVEKSVDVELKQKTLLMVLRVINNYGLDFKQFIEKEEVVERIIDLVQKAENLSV